MIAGAAVGIYIISIRIDERSIWPDEITKEFPNMVYKFQSREENK